jgi:uncharacterized protein (DUF433 family)
VITFKNDIELGNGIYTISDLAAILNLPQTKVRRWLNEFYNSRLGETYKGKYSSGEGRNKVTNFYTLIEFYVFYLLREHDVSVKKIIAAHEHMANQLDTPYPFATSQIMTEGKNIFYTLPDGTTMYADKSQQIVIKKAIESFCKKIHYSKDQLAQRYYPLGKKHHIVVDPHHQFGQPVIEGTNILADTIYSMYKAKEPMAVIANLYELSEQEVADAILFCKQAA